MKWKILPKKSNDLVEQLLINRGIKDKSKFFDSKISDFEKEIKIPGIEKSQKRILKAIENNELIIVYGDYDVDGITSCTILYKGLTSLEQKFYPIFLTGKKRDTGCQN